MTLLFRLLLTLKIFILISNLDIFYKIFFKKKNLIWSCKDSICNDPKMVLGSYVKGPNNIICKAWVEKLGLSHRTVVSHGTHGGRIEVS